MMRNIYTPHRADRIYDSSNNEVNRENRRYAPNYYEERYPERSLSSGRYIEDNRFDGYDRYDRYEPIDSFDGYDFCDPVRFEREEMQERGMSRREPQPQPKKSRVGLAVATVALTLAMVFSVGSVVFFATKDNNKLTNGSQNSVSTVSSDAAAKSAGSAETAAAQTASAQTYDASQSGVTPAMANAQRVYAGHNLEQTAEENIVKVDGERVYIDTKRPVPDTTGSYLHFNETGITSYGFDWTYSTDNANFVIRCDYNFDRQQYDFQFYGVTPGTANVTVWYNTSDNVQVPVQLTINVDNDLNVTQA